MVSTSPRGSLDRVVASLFCLSVFLGSGHPCAVSISFPLISLSILVYASQLFLPFRDSAASSHFPPCRNLSTIIPLSHALL